MIIIITVHKENTVNTHLQLVRSFLKEYKIIKVVQILNNKKKRFIQK